MAPGSFTVIPYQAVRLEGVVLEKPLLIAELRGDEIVVRTLGFYAGLRETFHYSQVGSQNATTANAELMGSHWRNRRSVFHAYAADDLYLQQGRCR